MCLMTTLVVWCMVVQVREGLGKTANATSLSVEAGLGQDSHGNTIVPIAASAGLKLHRYVRKKEGGSRGIARRPHMH